MGLGNVGGDTLIVPLVYAAVHIARAVPLMCAVAHIVGAALAEFVAAHMAGILLQGLAYR